MLWTAGGARKLFYFRDIKPRWHFVLWSLLQPNVIKTFKFVNKKDLYCFGLIQSKTKLKGKILWIENSAFQPFLFPLLLEWFFVCLFLSFLPNLRLNPSRAGVKWEKGMLVAWLTGAWYLVKCVYTHWRVQTSRNVCFVAIQRILRHRKMHAVHVKRFSVLHVEQSEIRY